MDQSKAALPTMITDAKINKHKAVRNITHIQIHTNIHSVIRKKIISTSFTIFLTDFN